MKHTRRIFFIYPPLTTQQVRGGVNKKKALYVSVSETINSHKLKNTKQMKEGYYTASDLSLYSISRDRIEDGLLFFCHCVNGFSFASHLDYDTGLYKFDDGQCDFYANGFDCQDCSNYKCIYRKNLY